MTRIYKLLDRADWEAAKTAGRFTGAGVDLQDGYIHLSTAAQCAETARRYYVGRTDLTILEVESEGLGEALKWEPSRGGDLFPHLYRPLESAEVISARGVPLDGAGVPVLGDLAP